MYDPQPRLDSAVDEDGPPPSRLDLLTPRQRAIAQLIAHGRTDHEIGVQLALQRTQVAEMAEDIRARLGVQRRIQIAALLRQDHARLESPASDMRLDGHSADTRPQSSQIREQAKP